jgi:hypothetical protein
MFITIEEKGWILQNMVMKFIINQNIKQYELFQI